MSIATMSKTLFQFFRDSQSSILDSLPRMAQVLLACLCGLIKNMEEREKQAEKVKLNAVTPNRLREMYIQVHKNLIGGTRPNVAEFTTLLDQLINNGICKIVVSKRLKLLDRPVAAGGSIESRF